MKKVYRSEKTDILYNGLQEMLLRDVTYLEPTFSSDFFMKGSKATLLNEKMASATNPVYREQERPLHLTNVSFYTLNLPMNERNPSATLRFEAQRNNI